MRREGAEKRGGRGRLVGIRILTARRPPVIPAKAGIQRGAGCGARAQGCKEKKCGGRGRLVGIKIYGIIGFSGFYRRVFDRRAFIRIHIGGI